MSPFHEVVDKQLIRRLADAAGLTEEQFLRAAGLFYIAQMLGGTLAATPIKVERAKRATLQVLEVERVLSLTELSRAIGCPVDEAEKAVEALCGEGKAFTANHLKHGILVALADDGSLNIATLNDEERDTLIKSYYVNRDKGVAYQHIYKLMKPKVEGRNIKELTLRLLAEGAKSLSDLKAELETIPYGYLSWTLHSLVKEGKVKRVKRGLYALA